MGPQVQSSRLEDLRLVIPQILEEDFELLVDLQRLMAAFARSP